MAQLFQQLQGLAVRFGDGEEAPVDRDQCDVVERRLVGAQRQVESDARHVVGQGVDCRHLGVAVVERVQMYLSAIDTTSIATMAKNTRIMPRITESGTMKSFFGVFNPTKTKNNKTASPN